MCGGTLGGCRVRLTTWTGEEPRGKAKKKKRGGKWVQGTVLSMAKKIWLLFFYCYHYYFYMFHYKRHFIAISSALKATARILVWVCFSKPYVAVFLCERMRIPFRIYILVVVD